MRSAYGHNANLHILGLSQLIGAGCDCGAGGYDVVHKQNVLSSYSIGAEQRESTFHVLRTVGVRQLGLTHGISRPLHDVVLNLNYPLTAEARPPWRRECTSTHLPA